METSTVNKILDHIFSNGFWQGVIILFVLGFFVAVYKIITTTKIKDAIALWLSSRAYKISRENLSKHHIFLQQALLRNKANSIMFKNEPLKSKVFQIFFVTKLDVDIRKIKEFIKQDFDKISKVELHIKMTSLIDEIALAYDKAIIPNLKELCVKELAIIYGEDVSLRYANDCTEKIYKHIMNSPKGYVEYRNYRIESLLFDLELIRESPIYDNNNERVYHFLDILNSSINKAILRAGKIFEDFNGEIDRIFKNQQKKQKVALSHELTEAK